MQLQCNVYQNGLILTIIMISIYLDKILNRDILEDLIFPDGVKLDHDRLPSDPFQIITPVNFFFVTRKLICDYVFFPR